MSPKPPTRFFINGDEFRHGTLSAAEEFHCVRRVAPLVKNTGAFVTSLAAGEDETDGAGRIAGVIAGSAPLLQAFADLSEEDSDYVIARCMAVTEAREDETWISTWSHETQAPALPSLRMIHVLRICYAVLREAISVFFSDAVSSLTDLGLLRGATTP